MEKELLRSEFQRLIYPEDLPTVIESYKLVTDAAFEIISQQKNKQLTLVEDIDCDYLFQMTTLKNLSILKLSESLNYNKNMGSFDTNNIFDPFALNNIVRSQFEAFCNFNNIYRLSKSPEEIKFKYNMWVLSGLKYRQTFQTKLAESVKKKEDERLQIIDLKKAITTSEIFKSLNTESQDNIQKAIKAKKWQIWISNERAHVIGWHEMLMNAGANKLLDGQYTFLSLSTHPSNVSVFQFKDMYSSKNDLPNSILAIKLSKWLISSFISDYCYYFKDAKEIFDKLPLKTQIMINGFNLMIRNESYKINGASSILN
jgi:hypothetical protein